MSAERTHPYAKTYELTATVYNSSIMPGKQAHWIPTMCSSALYASKASAGNLTPSVPFEQTPVQFRSSSTSIADP